MAPLSSGFRRLPIRLRLTVAFAGVLTAVLVAGGLVLYTEFQRDLDGVIDQDLESRAADMTGLLEGTRDPDRALLESGERVAQVYTDDGRLLASTRPVQGDRVLTAQAVR